MISKMTLSALGTLVALAGSSARADAACPGPYIHDVVNDVPAGGMFQGRVLTIEILGCGFGAAPGLVEVYDGVSGAYLHYLDASFEGMWWSDDHIILTIEEFWTQGYEPRVHAYDFKVVHSYAMRSNLGEMDLFKVWSLPRQADWGVKQGPNVTGLKPQPGGWDARFNGQISPAAAVKLNGTFYLYYIGAKGDRADGGPAFRTLGVATSTDGIHFQKRGKVGGITRPNKDEEGVFSAAAAVQNGQIVLYYSSCREVSPGDVACEGYRATSTNGLSFQGERKVLSGNDPNIESNSNELFPVGVIHDRDVAFDRDLWVVTYLWKDNTGKWYESSAWSEDGITDWRSGRLFDPDQRGGMANTDLLELPGQHTLLLGVRTPKSWPDYRPGAIIEVHTATQFADGAKLDFEYAFPNLIQATTVFDPTTRKWFLYGLEYARSVSCGNPAVTCHRTAGISVRTYTSR